MLADGDQVVVIDQQQEAPWETSGSNALAPAQRAGQVIVAPVIGVNDVELEDTELSGFSRLSMDGTDIIRKWLVEDGEELPGARTPEIHFIVAEGQKKYQSFDENSNVCESTNGQKTSTQSIPCATCRFNKKYNPDVLDKHGCKMKYEIKVFEVVPADEGWVYADVDETSNEPREVVWTMPTTTAMRFMEYYNTLKKAGYGIGQVATHVTVKRITAQKDKNIKYSQAEFEGISLQ